MTKSYVRRQKLENTLCRGGGKSKCLSGHSRSHTHTHTHTHKTLHTLSHTKRPRTRREKVIPDAEEEAPLGTAAAVVDGEGAETSASVGEATAGGMGDAKPRRSADCALAAIAEAFALHKVC